MHGEEGGGREAGEGDETGTRRCGRGGGGGERAAGEATAATGGRCRSSGRARGRWRHGPRHETAESTPPRRCRSATVGESGQAYRWAGVARVPAQDPRGAKREPPALWKRADARRVGRLARWPSEAWRRAARRCVRARGGWLRGAIRSNESAGYVAWSTSQPRSWWMHAEIWVWGGWVSVITWISLGRRPNTAFRLCCWFHCCPENSHTDLRESSESTDSKSTSAQMCPSASSWHPKDSV